ncbi:MAG: hypothetical protein KDJ69_07385 [Nitratireductor sp.]|nr:hypothetical protein [Nitratireductor sp.]
MSKTKSGYYQIVVCNNKLRYFGRMDWKSAQNTAFLSFLVFAQGCDAPPPIKSGKFSSMQTCLVAIQKATGLTLDAVRDNANIVSGYLGNTKRDFACERKNSGSLGVHIEGWYEE